MKNVKAVSGIYFGFFIVLLYFGTKFADAVLGLRAIDLADYYLFSLIPVDVLSGLVFACVLTLYFVKGKKGWYREELDSVWDELSKVAWPTKEETKVTTISVLVFVGISMLVIFLLDSFWGIVPSIFKGIF